MSRMIALALWIALGASGAFARDEGTTPGQPGFAARMDTVIAALPERRLQALKGAPEQFVEEMAQLIYGYGSGGAITEAQLEQYIAIRRAAIRGREMRRFLLADLNDDGRVTDEEIETLIEAEAATRRGALVLAFRKSDHDKDGEIDFADMRQNASAVAFAEFNEDRAATFLGLMVLDLDQNGALDLAEVVIWTEAFAGQL